ncbi:MAG: hypothetical protein JWR38_5246 [Mucilaginibacter sp.]|nr:hypothetical protein [Mucilaginibacter sp.]
MEAKEILRNPIQILDFSEQFKMQSRLMGYQTLQDIVDTVPEDLFNKDNFTYTWLGELSKFLIKHQILYLLQPAGGRKYV